MKAIALTRYLPIEDPQSLVDVELPKPAPTGRDLLVRVEAVSVNPVDTKIRRSQPGKTEPAPRVLGWDAAGVVEAVGRDVTLFKPGDAVYYAGSVKRPGTNSEFQLVDERLVGHKPARLSAAEAAALPLTFLTAWEGLFERTAIDRLGADRGRTLLVIGGAGGVGSAGIQLAKLAGLTVIASASRKETRDWVEGLGADHVVDHGKPLPAQVEAIAPGGVDFIANFADTDRYWEAMAAMIRPQGRILGIVENAGPLDLDVLKSKSASFAWEFMFTRALFETPDMHKQGEALNAIAVLVDGGKLRTTLTATLTPINAANLREAHARLQSGRTIGKLSLAGW